MGGPAAPALVIASGNAGKVREFAALLAALNLEVRPQPPGLVVEETGASFAANARLKATAVARATGQWALADDSGLSVDALGGAPGVHSARYADSDAARVERLLRELAAVDAVARAQGKAADRRARFTAALAVAEPGGTVLLEVEGVCEGLILEAPRGSGGFGYDPVFLVPEAGLSFAEMSSDLKASLGHRGHALNLLAPRLRAVLS
jgi:XTP/dITP diphosphohydrolase